MIAVDDIGRFAAEVFIQADRFRGREVDLAGREFGFEPMRLAEWAATRRLST